MNKKSSIATSKYELQSSLNAVFAKLMADYHCICESVSRECSIEGNIKGTTISVCDTVAYLIGWGKLVLKWHDLKSRKLPVDFPETGYKWNQLGLLAESFHQEYKTWKYKDLLTELERTIKKILVLISSLSNEQLYKTQWYKKWTLGRMIQFNTLSPMKNIRTKVRRFKKAQAIQSLL